MIFWEKFQTVAIWAITRTHNTRIRSELHAAPDGTLELKLEIFEYKRFMYGKRSRGEISPENSVPFEKTVLHFCTIRNVVKCSCVIIFN